MRVTLMELHEIAKVGGKAYMDVEGVCEGEFLRCLLDLGVRVLIQK